MIATVPTIQLVVNTYKNNRSITNAVNFHSCLTLKIKNCQTYLKKVTMLLTFLFRSQYVPHIFLTVPSPFWAKK